MQLRRWLTMLALLLPLGAVASDRLAISTTRVDPGQTCGVLESHLPKKLASFKSLGELLSEKTSTTDAYECDQKIGGCKIHVLKFTGLELDVLASGTSDSPWVIGATISSPRWLLLEKVRVGQALKTIEEHYGVKVPRDKSPVTLEGECTPLTIWHRNGLVTKLALDCQACY